MHRAELWRVPNMKISFSSGSIILLMLICENFHVVLPIREIHWKFSVQKCLLRLHYVCMIHRLITHMVELSFHVHLYYMTPSCH